MSNHSQASLVDAVEALKQELVSKTADKEKFDAESVAKENKYQEKLQDLQKEIESMVSVRDFQEVGTPN